jgi:pimeloyl-ACP methyl ester carboxylesterase
MEPRHLDLPVDGGSLRVLLWGTGENVAVAVHGISGSAMSWLAVARALPDDWTLAAPDLRGRGHSSDLPRPYGIDQHIEDVAAVVRHFGHPVLAGHSMGAFVGLLTHNMDPDLASRLVLVDGGLPLPFSPGAPDADLDAILNASLGPAITRLSRAYPSEQSYIEFWQAHPALSAHWTEDMEAYVRYDLRRAPGGGFRSRAAEQAVLTDGRDLLLSVPRIGEALATLKIPTPILTAGAGMFGEPPGIQPPELVATWRERAPQLRPTLVPDANHYTIMFEPHGAEAIAAAITGA